MRVRIYVDASVVGGCEDVNLRRGYPLLEIRTPREVLSDE